MPEELLVLTLYVEQSVQVKAQPITEAYDEPDLPGNRALVALS